MRATYNLAPQIIQTFNKYLLLTAIGKMHQDKDFLLSEAKKRIKGENKKNKFDQIFKLLEGLYEWEETKEEEKKKETLLKLLDSQVKFSGKMCIIVKKLGELI